MPTGRTAGEDEREEEVEVFKSPEWEPDNTGQDQGASPQLRRSARKRKSTAGEDGPLKNSCSKKKKASPGNMPKTARSPPKTQGNAQAQAGQSFEALLLAMEGRLTAKLERVSEVSKEAALHAKMNSESLEQLESRVDANENCLMDALRESEARIMAKVESQIEEVVKIKVTDLVNAQLHAAGFDQDLTASDLSVRNSAAKPPPPSTYAAAAAGPGTQPSMSAVTATRQDRQESNFLLARRQLRLWPIPGGKEEDLEVFLSEKLRMDSGFIRDEMGKVQMARTKEPKNKNKDEYIITFESKQIRDAVKAAAPNLANHRETAGMRLQIPAHLQTDFHTLMNLSYDLKKRYPGLKRNVKFDEDDFGLFMDLKLDDEGDWQRVKPAQARAANKKRGKDKRKTLDEDELQSLLGEEESDE